MSNHRAISEPVRAFLYDLLLQQNVSVGHPQFREVADLLADALSELQPLPEESDDDLGLN